MHLSTATVVFFVVQLAVAAAPACNADNCLRAVVASAFTTRHGSADCSSFLETTVSQPTVTIYEYEPVATVTATVPASSYPSEVTVVPGSTATGRVTVVPTSIPAYASACSGSSRYSSACSCIGVTGDTYLAQAATTYSVIPVTTTISYTNCPVPPPQFLLQIFNTGNASLDGTFATDNFGIFFKGANITTATPFSLTAMGYLDWEGYYAELFPGSDTGPLTFSPLPEAYTHAVTVVCSTPGGTLACQAAPGIDILEVCPNPSEPYNPNVLYIGNTVLSGCFVPTLRIVPVC